ncbi:RIN4, pathogenic type III effector avirulence factor Avr cleavage site [Trema orientale]|uniref:RIN4, pathogenic type III effector avirulence factor Avr cleavage site n=1 Tax=Trema orientale TaxID=63057 RepID=A0A2P5F0X0_TREOI|nr:RIN4, pathogenic type III effector avirulence factor Avr cleavage site [Trema orientale]
MASHENGRPLPKFGEWDVNDPASAEGFTVIFNKARDEKKTGGNNKSAASPPKYATRKQSDELKASGFAVVKTFNLSHFLLPKPPDEETWCR